MTMTTVAEPAKTAFQAEVGRLLHLMVHAVYTQKEIFLRELISNASDACDKLRYEAIATPALLGPDERLAITITPDATQGTLTISDNGIGMDAAELAANLGTIARSGTRAFLDKLGERPEGASLIGQFGVGFYSAFMVADEIDVISRKAGEAQAHLWHSDGEQGFTVSPASNEQSASVPRGTVIQLKLKPEAHEFLEPATIERIVRTYSDHILFPVELDMGKAAAQRDDAPAAHMPPHQINTASALWQRPKSQVTPEQYKELYRTVSGGFDAPALTIHYKAEGRQAYAVLLFVPQNRPFDLYDPSRKGRVKLYVRRVYITDGADLLPSYLRFVRGVVDSEDVPLNISREMLQNNPLVAQIRKGLTGRVLAEFATFAANDKAGYEAMWEAFGAVLKEALYEDFERRDTILALSRFQSSRHEGWRTLADVVAGFRPNQTEIYYLTGENLDRLRASPQLEAAHARGLEVLLMTDPIDSFWLASGAAFEGKPFKSLSQGDIDLSLVPVLEAETASEEGGGKAAVLAAKMKEQLGELVSDVRLSKRLVTSAVCLVAPGHGPDLSLDKLLARQDRAFGLKPVLEINPTHPLVAAIAACHAARSPDEMADLAHLLLDQAKILDGETPADPARFAQCLNRFVLRAVAPPPGDQA
jgi:molecular chaperone HtpG